MVEVFKTNITNKADAAIIVAEIHYRFPTYNANFDLQDCDRILRVKCTTARVKATSVIRIVIDFGYHAEVLNDENVNQSIAAPDALGNQR